VDNDATEQAQYHADRLAAEEAAIKAIKKAHDLGLSESECMAIAYECGVASDFYRMIRETA